MEIPAATSTLAALAHEGRLRVFRLLVQAGPLGMSAGEVARRLDMLPNTLSAQLAILAHAGLIRSRRQGRSIIYAAHYAAMGDLLGFLMQDCCGGASEVCRPLRDIVLRAASCDPRPAQPEQTR